MKKNDTKVVILGAGPGGYRAAFMAADLGLDVTLIDPEENPGGLCLYRGCIPSKALLHIASVKNEAMKAEAWGMKFSEPELNIEKIRQSKNSVVNKLTGGLGQLVSYRKIRYLRGYGRFKNSSQIIVSDNQGKEETVDFDKAIIATGAMPVRLPVNQPESKLIMYSSNALEVEDIPGHLLIIGGGYIGLEMATIYHSMGSKVSIVEMTADFMPGTDKDLVSVFKRSNKALFESVSFETSVTEINEKNNKLEVGLKKKNGEENKKEFDKVLIAIGHKPVTENLGLEDTRVETDEKGFIKVNEQQKTSDENIFAIGDIAGNPMLAHKASHQGRVAAETIAGINAAFDARAIPGVVYTDPEIAVCGLTERQAREKEMNISVTKFPWSASGRATTIGDNSGVTKLIIDNETERILGAGIAGKNAGEMIAEMVHAIEMGALASDVALTIHPHPTLTETIMEAAELFYGHPVDVMPPAK